MSALNESECRLSYYPTVRPTAGLHFLEQRSSRGGGFDFPRFSSLRPPALCEGVRQTKPSILDRILWLPRRIRRCVQHSDLQQCHVLNTSILSGSLFLLSFFVSFCKQALHYNNCALSLEGRKAGEAKFMLIPWDYTGQMFHVSKSQGCSGAEWEAFHWSQFTISAVPANLQQEFGNNNARGPRPLAPILLLGPIAGGTSATIRHSAALAGGYKITCNM